MEEIILFIAQKYVWFIGITLALIFALIGYFVDEHDRKTGISQIDKPKEKEKNIHDLAMNVGNKTLNTVVSDSVRNMERTSFSENQSSSSNNTIIDTTTNTPISKNPF